MQHMTDDPYHVRCHGYFDVSDLHLAAMTYRWANSSSKVSKKDGSLSTPFAPRPFKARASVSTDYPEAQHRSMAWRKEYYSLSDPHLTHYFRAKLLSALDRPPSRATSSLSFRSQDSEYISQPPYGYYIVILRQGVLSLQEWPLPASPAPSGHLSRDRQDWRFGHWLQGTRHTPGVKGQAEEAEADQGQGQRGQHRVPTQQECKVQSAGEGYRYPHSYHM